MVLEQAPQTASEGVVGQVQLPVGHGALSCVKVESKIPFQVAALISSGTDIAKMKVQNLYVITRSFWGYVPSSAGLPVNPFHSSARGILGTWTATGKESKPSSC